MKKLLILLVLLFLSKIVTPLQAQSLDAKEVYSLKKGYSLIIETTEIKSNITYKVELQKENFSKILFEQEFETVLPNKYIPDYRNIDFDDYFVLTSSGGNFIVHIELIEKSSGTNILAGGEYLVSTYDLENNILIYRYSTDDNEDMVLYDLKRNKKTILNMNDFTEFAGMGYWTAFKVGKVRDKHIEIIYQGDDTDKYVQIVR